MNAKLNEFIFNVLHFYFRICHTYLYVLYSLLNLMRRLTVCVSSSSIILCSSSPFPLIIIYNKQKQQAEMKPNLCNCDRLSQAILKRRDSGKTGAKSFNLNYLIKSYVRGVRKGCLNKLC